MTTSVARAIPLGFFWFTGSLLLLVSCSSQPLSSELVTLRGRTMGTSYTIRLAPTTDGSSWPPEEAELQERIDRRLVKIIRLMSTYDPNSELSRFNRSSSTDWFAVSQETASVVSEAIAIAEQTEGAFDPTVGPIVNLWGFGPSGEQKAIPSEEQIASTLSRVGYRLVQFRSDPPAIKKQVENVYLDLSGIAKGYASDEISGLLAELGFGNSMVEIGGEVRTRGAKAEAAPWRIGVQKPDAQGDPVQLAVPLRNSAMATSGDYRNYFEQAGQRYSHTIDPTTGRPVQHDLASVTIVAENCMQADALATAVLVMGDRKGYDWCEQQGLRALMLVRKGGKFVERRTPGFDELMEQQEVNKDALD